MIAAGALFLSGAAAAEPLGYEGARHLLARTGFGATDAQVREYAVLERAAAVDRVLAATRREALTAPPSFTAKPPTPLSERRALSEEQKRELQRRNVEQGVELREW